MLMCLWLEPLFLVVTDRDTYTAGLVPNVLILHSEAARGLRRF